MVGDGINDAPALAQADIDITNGAGTDIAIESSDVVLVGGRPTLSDARDIAVASFRKTKQNLAVSFGFNSVGVPLAVTGLVQPVWAMILSVSAVLDNPFGTRLRPALVLAFGRRLAGQARRATGLQRPARHADTGQYLAQIALALAVGAAFTALGSQSLFPGQ